MASIRLGRLPANPPTREKPDRIPQSAPTVALALLLAMAFVVLMVAGRHLTFFFDEWDFVLRRRGGSVGSYLNPHNGHIVLFEVAIYKLLFALVGLHQYWPYQAIGTLLHVLCAAILYVLARRRLGAWLALGPVAVLLFLGSAYEDLLWPFQIGWFASVAGGLGALALIERRRGRSDVWAALLLTWSLSGSAVGIAFLVACFGLLLMAGRSDLRRLWVAIGPAILFAIWYLGWGTSQQITSDSVLSAPQYVASSAASASAGLAGIDASWGPSLAVGLLALILFGFQRRRGLVFPYLSAAAGLGALSFWLLTAIARADVSEPGASRYLYIGGAFILLAVAEAGEAVRPRRGIAVLSALLLAGSLLANINALRNGEREFRAVDSAVRASLQAVQIAAPVVSPSFQPEPSRSPQITAGPFLAAARTLGSPGLTLGELETAPESTREHADSVIASAERLAPVRSALPTAGRTAPVDEAVFGGHVSPRAGCERFVPSAGQGSVDIRLAVGRQLFVTASQQPVLVYVRRVASVFAGAPLAQLPPSTTQMVTFPPDNAPALPWHVQLVSTERFDICSSG